MRHNRLQRELPLYLMLIPGFIILFVFSYIPMSGVVVAFQKFQPGQGIFGSPWAGLDNWHYLFSFPNTKTIIWNTLFISTMKIIAQMLVPILIALLLNELRSSFVARGVQTLIYLPHFLSWVILSGIIVDILSPSVGMVNRVLELVGIKPIFFLGSSEWFPFTLVITDVWKEFGFGTIVYLAALTGINPSLYEAATVDGASRWKQTWHITLPGMLPIIILMLTLSLGNILNAGFDQVFNLYNPLVYSTGDILDTFVYRLAFKEGQFGVATAAGLFKSVVSTVLISISYWTAYKVANYRIF